MASLTSNLRDYIISDESTHSGSEKLTVGSAISGL
jgi:hypothetical protein